MANAFQPLEAEEIRRLGGHADPVLALAFTSDGSYPPYRLGRIEAFFGGQPILPSHVQ